ncbi:MAG: efflux RND transporter periplasmic adaptor subunit [Bacteroidetes bacterium QS_9_68_14]|nr:MAG: efflux RND transporter periplasmic adaptor subunit [Bacteroidetes bacterium QS_9_68_14]
MAQQQSATQRILKVAGGLAVVLVLALGVSWWMGWLGGGEEGKRVETTEVQRRDITQTVTAFGRVQPEREITISPDVPGEIIALPVEEGERVQRGELLAQIEAKDYVAQTQQRRAGVQQAQADLQGLKADSAQARQEYERKKKLFEQEMISRQEFETAETAYEQAVAQLRSARYSVDQAQARLQESREQVQQTSIYAPIGGVVSRLNVEEGERVVGTDRQPGTEMMRIARLDQMEVEVDVNENDVVNVANGDTAAVEVDAYPDRSFEGIVTEIANSARVSGQGTQEQVTNFPVTIRLTSPHNQRPQQAAPGNAAPSSASDSATGRAGLQQREARFGPQGMPTFRPGMSATVDISTETVTDAVSVPIGAVTVRDFNDVQPRPDSTDGESGNALKQRAGRSGGEGGSSGRAEDLRQVVFLAEEGEARMAEVETGISDQTHIYVRSGLEEGQTIVTGPYRAIREGLRPGMALRTPGGGKGGGEDRPATTAAE